MRINKSLIAYTPTSGAGSGSVTSVALTAPTGFTVTGSPITTSGTLALSFTTGYGIPPLMTGNAGRFLTTNGTTMSWVNIAGTDITGAALTEVDDTNVTCTLGGTPSTSLLRSVSLTFGWAGQLAVSRGGTGAATLTGVVIGNGTSAMTAITGGPNQILRVNGTATGYEFYSATFLTNPMTLNGDMIAQIAGVPGRIAGPTAATKHFLTSTGTGSAANTPTWQTLSAADITGSALTRTNDTNVTITLGGSASTALLNAASLTMGWSGTLTAGRGGTGTSGVSGVMFGNLTAPVTGITGIGGQILRINPSTNVYEFWTATFMDNPMIALGDLIYGNSAGAPLRLPSNSTGNNMYLRSVSAGAPAWASIAGSDITGAALTETDDTNVTMTLGGTPANSLLRSVSMTLGWTGQLAVPRGGTGASSLTGVVIGNSTGAMTAVAGTSEQLLRRNTANTAYEFFTPTYLGNPMTSLGDIIYGNAAGAPLRLGANATATNKYLRSVNGGAPSWEEINAVSGSGTINYVPKWTASTTLGNSIIQDNGTNVGIGRTPSHKLDVGGNIGLNGKVTIGQSTVYNVIYDQSAASSITIGDSSTPYTYYDQTNHVFRNRGGTTQFAAMSATSFDVALTISAGNTAATNGSIMLQDNYSIGHLGNIGTMFSGGNLMMGYCVTPSTTSATGFLSSTTLTLAKSAIVAGEDIFFYTASAQSISIGSSVSMTERLKVSNNGQLKFGAYTSTSSFTGIVQGYLAFTSGGLIVTTATPGGVSGTQNYLAKFDSTGIAVGNSRIVDDGTNFLLNGASSVVTGLNLVGNFSATDSQGGSILLRRSAVPTSGQTLGLLDAYGITTGSTYQMGGGIEFRASQNWNSTSAGTELAIQTAPDNTIAPADMFVFLNNGAVRFIGRTSNPIGAAAGTMYYNSSANNMRYYNGTSWITF